MLPIFSRYKCETTLQTPKLIVHKLMVHIIMRHIHILFRVYGCRTHYSHVQYIANTSLWSWLWSATIKIIETGQSLSRQRIKSSGTAKAIFK